MAAQYDAATDRVVEVPTLREQIFRHGQHHSEEVTRAQKALRAIDEYPGIVELIRFANTYRSAD